MESRVTVRSFLFDNLISPAIVRLVFFVGLGAIVVASFWTMKLGFDFWDVGGSRIVLTGLGALVLGSLAWRLLCEVVIVLFKIHESLRAIQGSLAEKPKT